MKTVRKKKRRRVLKIVLSVVLTALFFATVICNSFIPQSFADLYCTKIFPYLSAPAQRFNMFFQHSLTENLVVCGVPFLAAGVVIWLILFVKKLMTTGAAEYLYKSYRNLMIIAITGAVIFQAMHGFNYRRTHVVKELELTDQELTFEDYCATLRWAYSGMIEARSRLGEDYNGVAHMSESFENSATYACSLISTFSEKYDIPLSPNYVRAKPVSLSRYWSYTHIVGMYDMFLCEANINTDFIGITDYPVTLCHELCHAKGYASETDCNLLSALACCSSTRADFRYAGYYEIFWNIYPMAEQIAEATGQDLPDYGSASAMEAVYRDMSADYLYWKEVDDEIDAIYEKMGINIHEVSNATNDTFLRTNGENGVESYVVPDSVYVRFYLTHVKDVENA